jgi:hypothetical protein
MTAFIAGATLASSYFLMSPLGILGVALSWLVCQTAAALFTAPYLWHRFFKR